MFLRGRIELRKENLKLKSEGGIKEHKSKGTKKMMRGRVEPFVVLIVVRVVPTLVHVARQTMKIPQMTIP
jgi:hypothetical protein